MILQGAMLRFTGIYSVFIRYLFARSPIEVRNKSEISPKKHRRNIGQNSLFIRSVSEGCPKHVRRNIGESSKNFQTIIGQISKISHLRCCSV